MRSSIVCGVAALILFVGLSVAGGDDRTPKVSDLWEQLSSPDEGKATRALLALAARPKEATAYLGQHLKVVKVDKAKVARWIEELGDDTFSTREEAMRELAYLGKFIKADLEKAAATKDPEVKKRVAALLARIPDEAKQPAIAPGLRGRNVQVQNINGQISITIDGKALDLTPPVPPKPDLDLLRTIRGIALLEHLGTAEAKKILSRLAEGEAEAAPTKEAKAALQRLEKR